MMVVPRCLVLNACLFGLARASAGAQCAPEQPSVMRVIVEASVPVNAKTSLAVIVRFALPSVYLPEKERVAIELLSKSSSENIRNEYVDFSNGEQSVRFDNVDSDSEYQIRLNGWYVRHIFNRVPHFPVGPLRSGARVVECFNHGMLSMTVSASFDGSGEFHLFSAATAHALAMPKSCRACDRGQSTSRERTMLFPKKGGEHIVLQRVDTNKTMRPLRIPFNGLNRDLDVAPFTTVIVK
jgi:hypothetical protein